MICFASTKGIQHPDTGVNKKVSFFFFFGSRRFPDAPSSRKTTSFIIQLSDFPLLFFTVITSSVILNKGLNVTKGLL